LLRNLGHYTPHLAKLRADAILRTNQNEGVEVAHNEQSEPNLVADGEACESITGKNAEKTRKSLPMREANRQVNARLNDLQAKFKKVFKKVNGRHSSMANNILQGTNFPFTRKVVEPTLPSKFRVPR
jgi:hypothetical protein